MLHKSDWEDVLREDKAQDDKWGSQIDVPLGTGANSKPLQDMQLQFQMSLGTKFASWLSESARSACQEAFKRGEGTWVGILLEEVFEAFAEEGGMLEGEALEEELLQVATVALKMRQAARHHRIIAELKHAVDERLAKYGVFTPCGHQNYGTKEHPASVYSNCIDCREYYCDYCNYDRHICPGCGEPYRHGEGPHDDGKVCIDLPEDA